MGQHPPITNSEAWDPELIIDGRVQVSVADGVALIRLNRPEKLNAFDGEQLQAFKVGINKPRSRGDREEVFGGLGHSWKGAFVGGDLLVQAAELGLAPYGVSFHVGSQQLDPTQWAGAIAAGPVVFERLDFRPLRISPLLPIAATQPRGEATRLDKVRAPSKSVTVIPGAGDHAIQTDPDAFVRVLRDRVRPIAIKAD